MLKSDLRAAHEASKARRHDANPTRQLEGASLLVRFSDHRRHRSCGCCLGSNHFYRAYRRPRWAGSNADMRAFQCADGCLKWCDARISCDANNCAVYQGRDLYGTTRTELLRNVDNSTFCGTR
jgi:hypothetical protein